MGDIPFIDLKTQYQALEIRIKARIDAVLQHGRYIMGPEVGELEEKLAAYVGVGHCIGVSSGTDALLIAMMALEIGPGDEVITTPFTFIATAETIALLGARPVFVDIEPRTCNIDPAAIEAAVTPRTKAIMPVSLYGQCADLAAINAIAARHGLPVIEDGAQSFGATQHGRKSCGLSTIGATSFFPSKPLGGYGDGGALFTDDDDLAKAMREIRIHGQERRYHHARIGLNGRLDTLQAAVLLAKFERFDEEIEMRRRAGQRYNDLLFAAFGPDGPVTPPVTAEGNSHVYAQYTVHLENRHQARQYLTEQGVPTAVHYPVPLHLQPAFASGVFHAGDLPVAEAAAERVMSLPMSPDIETQTITRIVECLRSAMA